MFSRSFIIYFIFLSLKRQRRRGGKRERGGSVLVLLFFCDCLPLHLLPSSFSLFSRIFFFSLPPLPSRTDTLQRTPMDKHQGTITKKTNKMCTDSDSLHSISIGCFYSWVKSAPYLVGRTFRSRLALRTVTISGKKKARQEALDAMC